MAIGRRRLDIQLDIDDEWPTDAHSFAGRRYLTAHDARWAAFFTFIGYAFLYRPRHFPITPEYGIRPKFLVTGESDFWFEPRKLILNPKSGEAANFIAKDTGIDFVLNPGGLFTPSRNVPPDHPRTPVLMVYRGEDSHWIERAWCDDGRRRFIGPLNESMLFRKTICDLFMCAEIAPRRLFPMEAIHVTLPRPRYVGETLHLTSCDAKISYDNGMVELTEGQSAKVVAVKQDVPGAKVLKWNPILPKNQKCSGQTKTATGAGNNA